MLRMSCHPARIINIQCVCRSFTISTGFLKRRRLVTIPVIHFISYLFPSSNLIAEYYKPLEGGGYKSPAVKRVGGWGINDRRLKEWEGWGMRYIVKTCNK